MAMRDIGYIGERSVIFKNYYKNEIKKLNQLTGRFQGRIFRRIQICNQIKNRAGKKKVISEKRKVIRNFFRFFRFFIYLIENSGRMRACFGLIFSWGTFGGSAPLKKTLVEPIRLFGEQFKSKTKAISQSAMFTLGILIQRLKEASEVSSCIQRILDRGKIYILAPKKSIYLQVGPTQSPQKIHFKCDYCAKTTRKYINFFFNISYSNLHQRVCKISIR